jgi:hypothetical protein
MSRSGVRELSGADASKPISWPGQLHGSGHGERERVPDLS